MWGLRPCPWHIVPIKTAVPTTRAMGNQNSSGKASCQFLSGKVIDEAVAEKLYRSVHPAHIDAMEEVGVRGRLSTINSQYITWSKR